MYAQAAEARTKRTSKRQGCLRFDVRGLIFDGAQSANKTEKQTPNFERIRKQASNPPPPWTGSAVASAQCRTCGLRKLIGKLGKQELERNSSELPLVPGNVFCTRSSRDDFLFSRRPYTISPAQYV